MSEFAITPYLFLGGRCEEAIEFYKKALGAEVDALTRYTESPEPPPPGLLEDGFEHKIMHASLKIRGIPVMLSDGCDSQSKSSGFRLALSIPSETDARQAFDALAAGGEISMPLTATFWSPCFGMLTDRFGIGWMVMVPPPV